MRSSIPRASPLLATLALGGCYLTNEPGTEPEFALEWSEVTTVFEQDPSGEPPWLHGSDHRVVALDGSFVVVWIFNEGQLGLAMSRFDWDARIEVPPTVLLPAQPPLEDSPSYLAVIALEDGTIAVYWPTTRRELWWLRASSDGVVLEGPEVLRTDLATFGGSLTPVRAPDGMMLRYAREDVHRFIPLGRDGRPSGEPRVLYPYSDPHSSPNVIDFAGAAHFVWMEQTSAGGSTFFASAQWDGSDTSMPTLIGSGESAPAVVPFVAADALWAEVSTPFESHVRRLDPPGASFGLSTSPNRVGQWWPLGETVLAVGGEADEPFQGYSRRLIYRHVDPTNGRVLDRMTVTNGDCPSIEGHESAWRGALAVTWVDDCGGRRLRARVGRPR